MDNTKVKEFAEHFLNDGEWLTAINKKEESCQYYMGGKGKNYCKATQQTECTGCRFFQPTMQAKLKLLVANLRCYEEIINTKKDEIDKLEERIMEKECTISALEEKIHQQEVLLWMDMISRATD